MTKLAMVPGVLALFCCLCEAQTPEPGAVSRPAGATYLASGVGKDHGFDAYLITSDYQEKPCKVWVLLPDGLDAKKKHKVVYFLPAEGVGDYLGLREAKKRDIANKYDVICVNPDFSRMPWYGDNPDDSKIRYDSYLTDVIVPFVDKTYPTNASAEGRITIGFSKSGIGAVSLLLRHPDIFGRAGAWDAPLMESDNHSEYYGSEENFKRNYYIPDLVKKDAEMLRGEPARIAVSGVGFSEGTIPFHKELDELGIPHFCDATWVGTHAWESGWVEPLVSVLMSEDMTQAKPTVQMVKPAAPRTKPTTVKSSS
jgi:hypothetical protein